MVSSFYGLKVANPGEYCGKNGNQGNYWLEKERLT